MIHVDLSILRHDDNCRYLDDEQFCTCGAADYERLQIVTAQLTSERAVSDRLLEALKMVSLTRRIEGIEHAIKLIAEVEAMRARQAAMRKEKPE